MRGPLDCVTSYREQPLEECLREGKSTDLADEVDDGLDDDDVGR